MFEDMKTKQKQTVFNAEEYELFTKVDEDREMRCDIMFVLPGTKHIEIRFFDFFVLIMKRTFSKNLKDLIRQDNFLKSEVINEKTKTKELSWNHGDKDHLVDSYRQFIDKYVPNITEIFTTRNKNFLRFVEN